MPMGSNSLTTPAERDPRQGTTATYVNQSAVAEKLTTNSCRNPRAPLIAGKIMNNFDLRLKYCAA